LNPIYLDTHIHTSTNPNQVNEDYDIDLLVTKIQEFNGNSEYLISLTDHNMINKSAYLKAIVLNLNIILGVDLHRKNYDSIDKDKIEKEWFRLKDFKEEISNEVLYKSYNLEEEILDIACSDLCDNIIKYFN
jgi:hypothetical protein